MQSTVVSITSQGQVTIPRHIRNSFRIFGAAKATIEREGNAIVVKPQNDFWSLSGSLKSKIKLTDKQLREARQSFAKTWGQE